MWVRETFISWENTTGKPTPGFVYVNSVGDVHVSGRDYCYKSDGTSNNPDDKWFSPIYMPREAARLFLRVTSVRAEKVQDISTSDCEREGLVSDINRFKGEMTPHHNWIVGQFSNLWDSINAKRGYEWDSNPWVWVISFERCEAAK